MTTAKGKRVFVGSCCIYPGLRLLPTEPGNTRRYPEFHLGHTDARNLAIRGYSNLEPDFLVGSALWESDLTLALCQRFLTGL